MILGDMGRLASSKLVPKFLFLRVSKIIHHHRHHARAIQSTINKKEDMMSMMGKNVTKHIV